MIRVGIDEAGRGCLAGPVVSAAVALPETIDKSILTDSKKLSEDKRQHIYEYLISTLDNVGIGIQTHENIDKINILQATLRSMELAYENLKINASEILIDGNKVPYKLKKKGKAIVKGDQLISEISAASIIAKVTRDSIMREYHIEYPNYGFNIHKGYATDAHYSALFTYGPSPIHRKSFNLSKQQSLFQ